MLALSASTLSYVPHVVPRSRPIVLSEYGNPFGNQGLKPLIVPNPAAPGQTSGLSWCVPQIAPRIKATPNDT